MLSKTVIGAKHSWAALGELIDLCLLARMWLADRHRISLSAIYLGLDLLIIGLLVIIPRPFT